MILDNFKQLDESKKIDLVKLQAIKVSKSFQKKELSNKRFIEGGIVSRKGIRGGFSTSLSAKNENTNDSYNKNVELLKQMVKLL